MTSRQATQVKIAFSSSDCSTSAEDLPVSLRYLSVSHGREPGSVWRVRTPTRAPAGARRRASFFTLLVVQTGCNFFGVALVIEGEEAVENVAAHVRVERPTHALLGLVEVVPERRSFVCGKVCPAVSGSHGGIQLAMQFAKFSNLVIRLIAVVKAVIDSG